MENPTTTGRSPHGRLRNYRAMSTPKLQLVWAAVTVEANDPEAKAALDAVLVERFTAEVAA